MESEGGGRSRVRVVERKRRGRDGIDIPIRPLLQKSVTQDQHKALRNKSSPNSLEGGLRVQPIE